MMKHLPKVRYFSELGTYIYIYKSRDDARIVYTHAWPFLIELRIEKRREEKRGWLGREWN